MTQSNLHQESVVYKLDGADYEGAFVYDAAVRGRRPGILVAHAKFGADAFARRKAAQLARLGFVALAIDLYGSGRLAKDDAHAAQLSGELLRDRALLRARASAGLKALRSNRLVEGNSIAAIGSCFGGAAALELARSGAELAGVVSFHGPLAPAQAETGAIHAKILVLHGDQDPAVPDAEVDAFCGEMRRRGADWQLIRYGGAGAFTNTEPGPAAAAGEALHALVEDRSWRAMRDFFGELFR